MPEPNPQDYPILTPEEWYELTEEINRLSAGYGWKNVSEALQYTVRMREITRKAMNGLVRKTD